MRTMSQAAATLTHKEGHLKAPEVTCPECGAEFQPAEAYAKWAKQEAEKETERAKAQIMERERAYAEKELALKAGEAALQSKVEAQVKAQLKQIQQHAIQQAGEKLSLEMRDLKEQLSEKQKALQESHDQQLTLRKQMRDVEEREKRLSLEVEKQVHQKLAAAKEEALQLAGEEHKFKLMEYEKKLKDLHTQLETAKRVAVQGSQQTQGEAVEEAFEDQLRVRFPTDSFEPVPKGAEGGDLVQRVRNASGSVVGAVVWELKNTKSYSPEWADKLARDVRATGADIGILVSRTLAKDAAPIEIVNGIFVVSMSVALPFAATLRKSLEELAFVRATTQGQEEKTKLLYAYLTGPAFKQKLTCIVQAFETIKDQLETEKRSFKRMWAAREKMLDQVIDSAASMCGDIEGIAGRILADVPAVKMLEIHDQELEDLAEGDQEQ